MILIVMPKKTNRILRRLLMTIVLLLLLPVVVVMLCYTSPVQYFAREWGSRQLTERLGYAVAIGEFRLRFPLRISLADVHVAELGSVESVSLRLRAFPLMQGKAVMDYLTAKNLMVRTDTLTSAMEIISDIQRVQLDELEYVCATHELHLRDVSLNGGDVQLLQHVSNVENKDSTSVKRMPLSLHAGTIRLEDMDVEYHAGAMQIAARAEQLCLSESVVDSTIAVSLQQLSLSDGAVALRREAKNTSWEFSALNLEVDSISYARQSASLNLAELSFVESHGIRLHEGAFTLLWDDGVVRLPRFSFRTEDSFFEGHLREFTNRSSAVMLDGDISGRLGYDDAMRLASISSVLPADFSRLYPVAPLNLAVALDGSLDALRITTCEVSLDSAFVISARGRVNNLPDFSQMEARLGLNLRTYDLDFVTSLLDTVWQQRVVLPPEMVCEGTFCYMPDTVNAELDIVSSFGCMDVMAGYRFSDRHYALQARLDTFDLHRLLPTGEWGTATLQADVAGRGLDYMNLGTSAKVFLHLSSLQWGERSFSGASLQASLARRRIESDVVYSDSLMRFRLNAAVRYSPHVMRGRVYAHVLDLDMRGLRLADAGVYPSMKCNLLFGVDSTSTYVLRGRFHDMAVATPDRVEHPLPLDFRAALSPDTLTLCVQAGDLSLSAHARMDGLPWQRSESAQESYLGLFTNLYADVTTGSNNPVSNYLSLVGVDYRSIRGTVREVNNTLKADVQINELAVKGLVVDTAVVKARYAAGQLEAHVLADNLEWEMPQMQLYASAEAMLAWNDTFVPEQLTGVLRFSRLRYELPTYSLLVQAIDTLILPFVDGGFSFRDVPLYTMGKQPLLVNGRVELFGKPSLQLQVDAQGGNLLQRRPTRLALLYGDARVSGRVALNGPFNALTLSGSLSLRSGSSVHYIYKDAMLTAGNQLDDVVTFVNFSQAASPSSQVRKRYGNYGFSMNLNVAIDPTVQLEVMLGASGQNTCTLQGGGNLNIQYIPAGGFRLSGKYTVEVGEVDLNVPLLHVNRMTVRPGSSVVWSGNVTNPMLDVSAEDHIRASVSMDGVPQSVLFVTGVSLTDTMDKLGLQFTLAAPENASMQNSLAALSPEERSKLAVALLTTGLYLGEGGTGNLMNTALMGFLQSQLDNISRDAFRTVDVSIGVEPLQDGVSGVSTRTDYSFSIAKRLWDDRIRIVVGGSVTISNERIANEAIIDNISVEWRINPNRSQYLRFYYDKNYESILEGEIRETGIGFAYRRKW